MPSPSRHPPNRGQPTRNGTYIIMTGRNSSGNGTGPRDSPSPLTGTETESAFRSLAESFKSLSLSMQNAAATLTTTAGQLSKLSSTVWSQHAHGLTTHQITWGTANPSSTSGTQSMSQFLHYYVLRNGHWADLTADEQPTFWAHTDRCVCHNSRAITWRESRHLSWYDPGQRTVVEETW